MVRVVGLGAGGHAKVVIDILRLIGGHEVVGLLDPNASLWGSDVLGVRVIGGDSLLSELYESGVRHAFVGLGTVSDSGPRRRVFESAVRQGFQIVTAIHPRAVVAPSARIGHGGTVLANAVINPDSRLGVNVIVNTGAIVEHDCLVGDHVHIAPGAKLAGGVTVGDRAHIGLGAAVLQGVRVGEGAVVGGGAVVLRDVPANMLAVGVPARLLRKAVADG